MDGIRIGKMTLFLTEMPNIKGLAFVFSKGSVLTPVAYVTSKNKERAEKCWKEMMEEF